MLIMAGLTMHGSLLGLLLTCKLLSAAENNFGVLCCA